MGPVQKMSTVYFSNLNKRRKKTREPFNPKSNTVNGKIPIKQPNQALLKEIRKEIRYEQKILRLKKICVSIILITLTSVLLYLTTTAPD